MVGAVSVQSNAATALNLGQGWRGRSRKTDQLGWLLVAPASIIILVLVL